jgi:hypothetical protein
MKTADAARAYELIEKLHFSYYKSAWTYKAIMTMISHKIQIL